MAEPLDDLPEPAGADGLGALLMIEEGLPRDEFGHPYQALFWFDAASRPIGLARDGAGRVVAYQNNAEGDPLLAALPCYQRVPDVIEAAARRWADQQPAPE